MNIAIMGAGLSGLSAAIILEQYGITPTILEKRSTVGDRFINCEIFLSPLTRPITDPIHHLSKKYGINLKPISNINKLIIFSENNQADITGQLGFTNTRGRHSLSYDKQLAEQISCKIIFNSIYSYEQASHEFTHIIVATGDAADAMKIQQYQQDLTVTLIGALVTGNFELTTVMAWLNNKLAPGGYGYLIPISKNQANIVIGIPEYPDPPANIRELWDRFFTEVCTRLDQNLNITDTFAVNNYIIGSVSKPRIGNTFFTGNNFGSIMPFLGFGQFASLKTGIFAALDICQKGEYQQMVKPFYKSYKNSLTLRKALETLNNHTYDIIVKNLNGTIGFILFNQKYPDLIKLLSKLLRPILWFKHT